MALFATTIEALDREWENYAAIAEVDGPSDGTRASAEGDDGVFAVRQSWLATRELLAGLSADFEDGAALMLSRAGELLDAVSARSSVALAGSLANFDLGRVLLFGISAVSVLPATSVAGLWVGNLVVRRLSRLSNRMRAMAAGDLDTPVAEVESDETGELAGAFRAALLMCRAFWALGVPSWSATCSGGLFGLLCGSLGQQKGRLNRAAHRGWVSSVGRYRPATRKG